MTPSLVICSPCKSAGQLSHCLVKWNIFEKFDPGKEDTDGHSRLEPGAGCSQHSEVRVVIRILQQSEYLAFKLSILGNQQNVERED